MNTSSNRRLNYVVQKPTSSQAAVDLRDEHLTIDGLRRPECCPVYGSSSDWQNDALGFLAKWHSMSELEVCLEAIVSTLSKRGFELSKRQIQSLVYRVRSRPLRESKALEWHVL